MSLTKTDLEFFDLKAKTLKCLEVKYKSPVTCCPKNKMGKPCFSCPEINGPINFNNKNNNNNNNNNTFSHTSQAARVLGVIHTAKRMVSSQTPWTSWSRFTSVPGKYAVWRRQTELSLSDLESLLWSIWKSSANYVQRKRMNFKKLWVWLF